MEHKQFTKKAVFAIVQEPIAQLDCDQEHYPVLS